jgi:phosphatidylserine decarboxylase
MDDSMAAVVSPCDAKLLPGYFEKNTSLSIKGKFFDFEELISKKKHLWKYTFNNGTFGVFRLTPEKYHYNHAPVSGYVADHYEIDGSYHSCNPSAVVKSVTPFSKNKRVVTIFNTDVKGGSNIGYVAMIEIVALMIGDISQRYCSKKYDSPQRIVPGLFVEKGQPKSLFRPGSSTVVLMFEKNRFRFSKDIVQNAVRKNVFSRYSRGFGTQLVETDIDVRSTIGFSEEKYAPTFKKGN